MQPSDLTLRDWLDILAGSRRCLLCQPHDYADADTLCEHVTARDVVPEPSLYEMPALSRGEERRWCTVGTRELGWRQWHHPTREGVRAEWQRQWVIGHTLVALFSTLSEWSQAGEIEWLAREAEVRKPSAHGPSCDHLGKIICRKDDGSGYLCSNCGALVFDVAGEATPEARKVWEDALPIARMQWRAKVEGWPHETTPDSEDGIGGAKFSTRRAAVPGPHGCTHSGDWEVIDDYGRSYLFCQGCGHLEPRK